MHGSQRVNSGRRKSGRGETVNCCGGKYTEIAPTVWPAPSPTPSDARTPIPPPSSSHSSANQQICDLSVVMNRGRLQPWLPPQAQMDDSGLLKCFLRHSGWHSQGERRWAMLCFITPFFFFNDVYSASGTTWNTVRAPGAPTFTQLRRQFFSPFFTPFYFSMSTYFEIWTTCMFQQPSYQQLLTGCVKLQHILTLYTWFTFARPYI